MLVGPYDAPQLTKTVILIKATSSYTRQGQLQGQPQRTRGFWDKTAEKSEYSGIITTILERQDSMQPHCAAKCRAA
jgi:hypothetical protein